ncbi:MAG: glycosyl transferase [Magnetococcales bacterium]|nr:glycosyl transferase [Magnetococcales bacterium]
MSSIFVHFVLQNRTNCSKRKAFCVEFTRFVIFLSQIYWIFFCKKVSFCHMKTDFENLNILQVTAALHEGGVERGTVEMSRFLVNQGCGSFVASSGGQMVEELTREGGVHFNLPLVYRNPFSILYSAFKLKGYIQRNHIKLVHARSRAPAWAAYLAAKWTGTPFITTFHGAHKIQNKFKHFYNSSMVRGLRVVAISQFIKDHVIENYGIEAEKIDIACRGVDLKKFDVNQFSREDVEALKEKWGCEGKFVITLPGRLTRWKGQLSFLKALKEIESDDSWHALLVGGASKKKNYLEEVKAEIERLGLISRVTLTGGQKDIAPFYAMSDVIVCPSLQPEAFGRVPIEAGAMKKPIVAAGHGGALETVKDNETGVLFPVGDHVTMAKILLRFIKGDIKTTEMGKKGYEWVLNSFTLERMCEAEWSAYLKVLGEK